ncbi:Endonuclease/exonuclease/phosphatase [Corchorus capsularis]|uniref:Endonuclease/exonuclease/phosphatase n=1 Tax=Corchorus capsularis TaxID=210143 RepID=A0A1R3G0X2_COCAP|nr:Endonuclease/exonuclease/phosphatase [Corchorus capsularis]
MSLSEGQPKTIVLDKDWFEEKDGGDGSSTLDMKDFHNFLLQNSLFDHTYTGTLFTWYNKNPLNPLARKLDRVLITDVWLDYFPNSWVEFLAPECSDHSPALLRLDNALAPSPKPFKFFNFWTQHENYLKIVEQSWSEPVNGNPIKIFSAQPEMIAKEKQTVAELNTLILAEEEFFKQKSRIQWLKAGDQNTGFFHKIVKAKQSKGTIKLLCGSNNERLESTAEISNEALNYSKAQLGSTTSGILDFPIGSLKKLLPTISDEDFHMVQAEITQEEIKSVMFSIPSDKSPGPDGCTAHFYKSA